MTTRRLALFLIASFVGVQGLVLAVLGARYEDTGLLPVSWFAEGRQGRDSWDPMAQAYFHATAPHRVERPFYWRTAFSPQVLRKGFQYPPTALVVVSALDRVLGARWPDALRWITWAMVPATAVFVWMLYERLRPPAAAVPEERAWAVLAAVLATLTFYPVMRAYANGQMQTWLNALFATAVWCWAGGRRGTAGVLLALSCAVKPQLAVFLLWGTIRREGRLVAAFAATSLLLLGVSVALYGWAPHVEYLGMLRFLGERGEAFFPNQSVNGLLNRWLFNGDILFWKQPWVDHFPPYDARVFVATAVSSVVLLALALLPPRAGPARAGLIDFCLMGLAATMASPIAWEHHYGVALPIFVVAYRICAAGSKRTRAALAVSYVFVANCLWVTKALAGSRLNVLESYLFFGAIVLLVVLVRCRRPLAGRVPAPPAPLT
ncbi:MAG TPA: glycosyltransferase family 87 protein [Vicinamibacteria bacterium]